MSYDQHIREADESRVFAQCAVVTLSDTRTSDDDTSGRCICDLVIRAGHLVCDYQLIRDDPNVLDELIGKLIGRPDIDVILTNGGTGVSRRDATVPVIERRLDTPLPGFGELFRMLSWEQVGSGAMLSRAVGGVASGKLLFAMPGSTKAVELAMTRLILPELKHLLREIRK